jgi:hypothetical protein
MTETMMAREHKQTYSQVKVEEGLGPCTGCFDHSSLLLKNDNLIKTYSYSYYTQCSARPSRCYVTYVEFL